MTASEAIAIVDKLKPNKFTNADKYKWLSDIDGLIIRELIDTHEGGEDYSGFKGYDSENDKDTTLIVPAPYDILYRWYLESQIDLGNMEIGKYNNTKALFNNAYVTWTDYYNRNHLPKQTGFKFSS